MIAAIIILSILVIILFLVAINYWNNNKSKSEDIAKLSSESREKDQEIAKLAKEKTTVENSYKTMRSLLDGKDPAYLYLADRLANIDYITLNDKYGIKPSSGGYASINKSDLAKLYQDQFNLEFIYRLHPELKKIGSAVNDLSNPSTAFVAFGEPDIVRESDVSLLSLENKLNQLVAENAAKAQALSEKEISLSSNYSKMKTEIEERLSKQHEEVEKLLHGSTFSTKYFSQLFADYVLYDFNVMDDILHGHPTIVNDEKAIKIRAIKRATKTMVEEAEYAVYQLNYLFDLFPDLKDYVDYSVINDRFAFLYEPDVDPVRRYIGKDDYERLPENERNQLALDNYIKSRKTNWEIGRDYELFVGSVYHQKGFDVDYFGSFERLSDFGRDLIAKKGNTTQIIQCKYWASEKIIREKFIQQLFGTAYSYSIENNIPYENVVPVFVTNIGFSKEAIDFAQRLGVKLCPNVPFQEFPRIKCNVASDGTKIFHLPFDQQYDKTKIKNDGEFFCTTVSEATHKGFRRAWRWHGEGDSE